MVCFQLQGLVWRVSTLRFEKLSFGNEFPNLVLLQLWVHIYWELRMPVRLWPVFSQTGDRRQHHELCFFCYFPVDQRTYIGPFWVFPFPCWCFDHVHKFHVSWEEFNSLTVSNFRRQGALFRLNMWMCQKAHGIVLPASKNPQNSAQWQREQRLRVWFHFFVVFDWNTRTWSKHPAVCGGNRWYVTRVSENVTTIPPVNPVSVRENTAVEFGREQEVRFYVLRIRRQDKISIGSAKLLWWLE